MYGDNYYGGVEYGGRRTLLGSAVAVIVRGVKKVVLTTYNQATRVLGKIEKIVLSKTSNNSVILSKSENKNAILQSSENKTATLTIKD